MSDDPDPFRPIATRPMTHTGPDGSTEVHVDFGLPFPVPADAEWRDPMWGCRYRTRGFARDECLTAYGADGVQALYLAMTLAGARLAVQPEAAGLDWSALPHFGFPPPAGPGW